MKTDEIYVWFWVFPAMLLFWILARLFFIAVVILFDRNNAEKFIWNEEINPEKLKVCVFLFLVATFFAYFSFKPFFSNKFTPDLWITFSIGTLGVAGMCLLIENKLRTPSKNYLNNTSVDIENDVSYNNQNDVIGDDKVINQEKPQLQSDDDIEAHDIIDVKEGVEEISQPLDAEGSVGHLNKKQKQDDILETISSGKESRRAVSRVLIKSSDVVPDGITDEIIQDKIAYLKESYGFYCDKDDFASVLKKKKINKKILFVDKDNKTAEFKGPEYLMLLNVLLDGNIFRHPQNKLVVKWIHDSFDSSNIKKSKITSGYISKFKRGLKK